MELDREIGRMGGFQVRRWLEVREGEGSGGSGDVSMHQDPFILLLFNAFLYSDCVQYLAFPFHFTLSAT